MSYDPSTFRIDKRQIDYTGKTVGRLSVITLCGRKKIGDRNRPCWFCVCECGNFCLMTSNVLASKNKSSCGCGKSKSAKRQFTHGMSKTKVYRSWNAMWTRCTNKKSPFYGSYGGKGISICERWEKFSNFFEDMGLPPSKFHSVDRIDVNGNYCKENCRWANPIEQARNTRRNRIITYKGKSQCITAWEEELNLPNRLATQRYNLGERDLERLFRRPEKSNNKVRSGYVKQRSY